MCADGRGATRCAHAPGWGGRETGATPGGVPGALEGAAYDAGVRRAARYLSSFGPLLVVLAMSKVHAAYVADPPYD